MDNIDETLDKLKDKIKKLNNQRLSDPVDVKLAMDVAKIVNFLFEFSGYMKWRIGEVIKELFKKDEFKKIIKEIIRED